jgi:small subunit ribosomal protein S21
MAVVNVNPGESIESALRRFKRKVMTEEIIKDAKKHAFFMPPGQKAKLKSALARKRPVPFALRCGRFEILAARINVFNSRTAHWY